MPGYVNARAANRCSKTPCGRVRVFGSRCAKHWLRRLAAYRELPTHTLWWRRFEPAFVAGLELRALVMWDEVTPEAVKHKVPERWLGLVERIINAADKIIERQKENRGASPIRGEED